MIIDFHTHAFPKEIAARTIEHLEKESETSAFTNGTLEGLKNSMKKGNIDISVILPVATKPEQFQTINEYAQSINNKDGIISFGGIHPYSNNYKEELKIIKDMGLLGIKLHPDYQKTLVNDIKYINIVDYAATLDLIVVFHAGVDIGFPHPVHCTPQGINNLINVIDYPKLVFAHLGGFQLWDEVEDNIVGKNVFFDIGFCFNYISDEQFKRIVINHGADRILFGTDSPWSGQLETLNHIRGMDFTEEEMNCILFENGKRLLNI